ncbi:DUF4133 domain-containing protein [Porphyromonas levii]|uniref:DUF4133 domain-containing protein n=1 Tax=Porphyromonas levii TaxID=28114 RepID=UPI00037448E0|nr:DUF4133 domain-containing protein [Porphyromonas levii]
MTYTVNKGVGAPYYVGELSKTYAIASVLALVTAFMFSVITSSIGLSGIIVIGGGLIIAVGGLSGIAKLNGKFGENGHYKFIGKINHPQFIIHRRTAQEMLNSSNTR